MCCLRYEHEFYVQSRKRFPKEGKLIRTKRGEEKILSNDIFRDRVTLRGEDGEVRTIELAELQSEAETVGAPLPLTPAPVPVLSPEDVVSEEEIDIVIEEDVITEVVVQSSDDDPDVAVEGEAQAADGREKRPHRRRGRRGGRRNRQGGGGRRAGDNEAPGDSSGEPTQGES